MQKVLAVAVALYRDGYRVLGLVAPLLSASGATAKLLGMTVSGVGLEHVSWAWVFAPATIWLLVAYIRRYSIGEESLSELQRKYTDLLDEYPYALRLDAIDLRDNRVIDPKDQSKVVERAIVFVFQWLNTIGRPIEYQILSMAINGHATQIGSAGEVIGGKAKAAFYSAGLSVPIIDDNQIQQYNIEMEAKYGRPGVPLSRKLKKKIKYAVVPSVGDPHWTYIENIDLPVNS